MRIAMIGQKRTGSREGGVEVVVTELATRLVALGHEVTCYDRMGTDVNGMPTPTKPYEYKGVRVVPVPTVNVKGLAAFTSAYTATHAALKSRPDIIHYHSEGPCNALPRAAHAGIHTVATIHGLDWQRAKWGNIASRIIKRGERRAAQKSDALIVLSQAMQRYFQKEYRCDAAFIPNGIRVPEQKPAQLISKQWGLTKDSYILYLSRLVPEKRPELLLQAFQKLKTDKRLVIAGMASDTSEFYKEISLLAKRDPRVLLVGFVEGDILAELYSNAYCYVLPSDIEGMPVSLLEAMAYGCCCITSDISECSDVLRNTGMIFPRGNAEALRCTLASLLAQPNNTATLGKAARERAKAEFNWDSIVQRTLEIYRGVLS